MQRWKQRPAGSNWGDYGPDDQLGRLNLITEEQVLKAAREIRAGKTFCLSLPLDLPGGNVLNPRRHPPQLSPTRLNDTPYVNFPLRALNPDAVDVLSDDQVLLSMQYSTQWDSLAHVGALFDADGDGRDELVYYNGFRAGVDVIGPVDGDHTGCGCNSGGPSAALKIGVENLAEKGMQGRGVLVDLAREFGTGRTLIGAAELRQAMKAQNVDIESGDMLVLRTGYAEAVVQMQGKPDADVLHQYGAALDGTDEALLSWISDSGIAAICADNYAVEAYPARDRQGRRAMLPLHHHCLFKLGLPLAELWYLKDLAQWLQAHGRNRFMLTAPPLRLPHAIGSPVTPIATV
ncbi:cyclase family protein [Bordetella pseudohinzii]|uniref:Cyclase n=2 Tax=Bordetella pseudohinzii TaxID=1331258 RepID=A0A0J6F234_9BORD|nr:cyclase family protein [Bordetella pseudohinzii]ANY17809.1 cyclase [Bordetella pseudohinzii]KMM26555.1 cyclase [Bordetella pseudohinzii]KXA77149.1 cyclase [Bordetella pseudohinzii]KXA77465.1 cyclase [Bordetella pseudohinzii]CUI77150.1 Putative cyclase [Bordetella pseudohinzii]